MEQDSRTVLFVVDEAGGRGKSFLAEYLQNKYPSTHFTVKFDRLQSFHLGGVETIESMAFDYGREIRPQSFSWDLFGQLKNGSAEEPGRYKSPLKLAVFTNHDGGSEYRQLFQLGIDTDIVNLDQMYAEEGDSMFDDTDEDTEQDEVTDDDKDVK